MELHFSPAGAGRPGPNATSAPEAGPAPDEEPGGQPRIDLIQCYDEYIMGYSQSRYFLGGSAPARPDKDTPMHVVLKDGRMIGSWRHVLAGGRCELDIRTGQHPGPAHDRAIDQAVAEYGMFLGLATVRK